MYRLLLNFMMFGAGLICLSSAMCGGEGGGGAGSSDSFRTPKQTRVAASVFSPDDMLRLRSASQKHKQTRREQEVEVAQKATKKVSAVAKRKVVAAEEREKAAEAQRVREETARKEAEEREKAAEAQRVREEAARKEAEEREKAAEAQRVREETARKEAEEKAAKEEEDRLVAEAEVARVTARSQQKIAGYRAVIDDMADGKGIRVEGIDDSGLADGMSQLHVEDSFLAGGDDDDDDGGEPVDVTGCAAPGGTDETVVGGLFRELEGDDAGGNDGDASAAAAVDLSMLEQSTLSQSMVSEGGSTTGRKKSGFTGTRRVKKKKGQ